MYAQRQRQFAVVVVIVANELPDHLLARIWIHLAAIPPLDCLVKIANAPTSERILNHLSGYLESLNKFRYWSNRTGRWLIEAIPDSKRVQFVIAFCENPVNHPGAGSDNVRHEMANRPQVRRGS